MIGDVRAHLAGLISPIVPCAAYPPATLTPPMAVLLPGSPYWEATNLKASTVGIEVQIVTNTAAGNNAAPALDTILDAVIAALVSAGVFVGPVLPPIVDADTAYLIATIPTVTVWED